MSEDAKVAWSAIKDNKLALVENDTAVAARGWLSAHFHSLSKAVAKATRMTAEKDETGHAVVKLTPSGSPLKELSETACRGKRMTWI